MAIPTPAAIGTDWSLAGIKILLLMVPLSVVGIILVPALGGGGSGPVDLTRVLISQFESALSQYKFDHEDFPSGSCEEVVVLLMTPSHRLDGKPTGPYIEEPPKDKHGQFLNYEWPNSKVPNATKPAIWSSGLNKQNEDGAGDDINNWTEQ